MFGRRKKTAAQDEASTGGFFGDEDTFDNSSSAGGNDARGTETAERDETVGEHADPDLGPFDLTELDEDRDTLAQTRLDLGSVLVPLPAGGQLQVEMNQGGAPQAVHVVTAHGRITIAAYAAPKSPGQWREVAADLATSLRSDQSAVSMETGPWGRELHGVTSNADLRFIGVDGYRWMIRCVLAGPAGAVGNDSPLVQIARDVLAQTVVDRGTEPHPVRTPLPVVLPAALTTQLAAAQQQQAEQAEQARAEPQDAQPQPQTSAAPANQTTPTEGPRRGSSGSAMQQLGG